MTQAAIAAEVHQTLDVHRTSRRRSPSTVNLADLLAQLFHFAVGQVLDLLARTAMPAASQIACARGAADAVDRRQADLGVLVIAEC